MKSDLAQVLQRDHYFAIVDEVDSILIDEARTPLIISGPSQDRSELYIAIDKLIPEARRAEHYDLDEKQRTTTLTEEGNEFVERRLREMELPRRRTRRSTTPRAPTSSTTSTRRCARTSSSTATRTTSSATAR